MELSLYWEANNCSVTPELPSPSWNLNVHHHIEKSLIPILGQISPVWSYFFKTYFNSVLPSMSRVILVALCVCFPPMHAACSTHFTLFDLIILVIFGKRIKLSSSSLSYFLQTPTISSLLHPNILLTILYSNTLTVLPFVIKKIIHYQCIPLKQWSKHSTFKSWNICSSTLIKTPNLWLDKWLPTRQSAFSHKTFGKQIFGHKTNTGDATIIIFTSYGLIWFFYIPKTRSPLQCNDYTKYTNLNFLTFDQFQNLFSLLVCYWFL